MILSGLVPLELNSDFNFWGFACEAFRHDGKKEDRSRNKAKNQIVRSKFPLSSSVDIGFNSPTSLPSLCRVMCFWG